ncbi:RHS repeat-associated core domain-containing protein [Prosthecobacter debontii]|uniref:RHS repeat-associated core domain-containing protein n=1 Tax=Prosthecobacter debontii TaxID=48467 RepID=UPI001C3784E6|nr:RHS repeat-associated core domain-containing protein [Prosthecobacter debontii]
MTTTYTYDEACQLVRKSVTGQANYLYHYDYRGFADKEGYDINGDNVLTPGSTDIITERERYYELDAGDWWLVNKVSRYVTDGNGTQKLTTTSREKQNIAAGWVTQTLSPDGEMEQTTRTRSGKTVTSATTSTRYPGRTQTQVLYNGRLVSSQSFSQSQPVTYLYDALGRQTTVTDHGTGESQTTAYSPTTGQVISQTNGAMESTSYGYYANTHVNAGQVNWIQNSAGLRTYYAYNTMGLQTHQWGAAAQPVRYNYDGLGRLLSLDTYSTQTPSLWSVSSLPTSSFNSGYSRRDFVMSNNRLSSRTYGPGSGSVSYLYQTDGSLDTRTWGGAGGGVTDYAYDTAGRTTGIDYSDSTPDVSATYDRAGRLSTLTDAAGSHTFAHEANGDVVETVTSGLLNGLTLTKTSDVSGQVATLEWSFAGVSQKAAYTYDSQKRLETANLGPVTGDPLVTATYGYHSGSQRVHTLTRPIATGDNFVGTYTQDLVGRLDTLIWQRGATVHGSYDYDLDTAGRRDKETRHDGTWLDYGYNDRGELTSAARKRTSDNSTRQDWSHLYTYDDAGNPSTTGNPEGQTLLHAQSASGSNYNRTITAAQKRWLRGVAHPNAVVKVDGQTASREGSQWRYLLVNPAPPAAQRTKVVASRPDRSPEPVPVYQTLTLPASPSTWVFNERGNLTSDAQWTYTWDMENRLIVQEQKFPGITGDGPQPVKRLEFSYDAKGRRIAKRVFTNQRQSNGDLVNGSWTFVQETVFLWQDWTLLAEFVRSSPSGSFGLRRSYLWGLDVDGTFGGAGGVGGLLWVAEYVPGQSSSHRQLAPWYDGNGNIMGWLEKDGTQSLPLYRLEYDPYGKLLVEETVRVVRNQKQRDLNVDAEWLTRPPFAFSTKYEDAESGLLYYGYRYYAPEMQRWLSRDPIGEEGGINLYGMVGNDMVNQWDYLGLSNFRPGQLNPFSDAIVVALAAKFAESGDDLGAKGILHFAYGLGAKMTLSRDQVRSIDFANKVNVFEHEKVVKAIEEVIAGEANFKEVSDAKGHYTTGSGNGNNLLGSFTVVMKVKVTCNGVDYKVEGTFKILDRYDFDPRLNDPNSSRTPAGESRTRYAYMLIRGLDYDVDSVDVPFTQTGFKDLAKY